MPNQPSDGQSNILSANSSAPSAPPGDQPFTEKLDRNLKKIRRQAKRLHESRWIYGLYGALDGLSKSFSMLKYFFDAYYANSPLNSADVLHDWSLTSEGIAVMVVESVAFITFSVMGNLYDEDDSYALHKMSYEDVRALTAKGNQSEDVLQFANSYIWNGEQLLFPYEIPSFF